MLGADSPVLDIAEDLLGPCVRTHHGKLNFKWPGGDPEGTRVRWHQDIQYFPHSNYSPLTIGVYLEDVDDEMGPLGVVPESHVGPLYTLRDDGGRWTGYIQDDDLTPAGVESAKYIAGPAGTVTVRSVLRTRYSEPLTS
jgi:ectoine hydroxylase